MDSHHDVRSVFDVGCSLGYVLRFAETSVFQGADRLRGMDVDRYAVATGQAHLRNLGSKIELVAGDVRELSAVMGMPRYDVVLCCGLLQYLNEDMAKRTIQIMLAHTASVLGIITLAHPDNDNAHLPGSVVRPEDLGFIHNVEAMIQVAGGEVMFRKWTGPLESARYPRNPPLFVIARPSGARRGGFR